MTNSDDAGGPPTRRARKGGLRKSKRWPNGPPGTRPGQKPFDPLAKTWVEQGKSALARKARTDRERNRSEAEWLAQHLQLTATGSLPEEEKSTHKSEAERKRRYASLLAFPPMPPAEVAYLAHLIKNYGLPLSALPSDTAAFVVRRVMMDFHRLSVLRRTLSPPMFTPDELLELMRVLKVNPTQLAELTFRGATTRWNAVGSIHRWMHGASKPTSVLAIKINRLIEQNVRRKASGGHPEMQRGKEISDKPQTVERRERKTRARRRSDSGIAIPLSYAAQRAREEADADARERAGEDS